MRPAEFTPEEIIAAGRELTAAGRNVTGFALRQKVGGGNPGRLRQVWDDYLNSKAETKAEPATELPAELAEEIAAVGKALSERLMQFAAAANDKAVKAAERRVTDILNTAAEQRTQTERELADAAQTVEDLETKLDEAKATAEGLESQLSVMQATGQAEAVKLAQISERLTATEADRSKQAQQAEQLRNERDAARESAAKAQGQIEALQAQVHEFMQAIGNRQPIKKEKP